MHLKLEIKILMSECKKDVSFPLILCVWVLSFFLCLLCVSVYVLVYVYIGTYMCGGLEDSLHP